MFCINYGDKEMSITLDDLEIRYQNIRKNDPKIRQCSVRGCKNPRDTTPGLGEDTSCAYHRLLFDHWITQIDSDKVMYYIENQTPRRAAFTRWRNKVGKEYCDKAVLYLAQEGINWVC